MRLIRLALPLISAVTAFVPVLSRAQSGGLDDMIGARAGQAEQELERRGWRNTGGEKGDDRSYSYWWNDDRRQCVTIATADGRYASITPTTAPDCHQSVSRATRPDYGYGAQPARPPQPGYQVDPGYGRPPPLRPPYSPDGDVVVGGQSVDLGLVCFGDGARDGVASGTTWTWNRNRDRYEYGRYNEARTEVFDASLMIQLWNGGGRIRLPKKLIPPLNSRGNQGWWDLYDVQAGPDRISASYRLNGLNKPRVSIDRRSGRITVQGFSSYGFSGTCDTIGNGPRRF